MVCGKESDISDLAYIAGNAFGIIEDVIEGLVCKGEGSGIILGGNFPAALVQCDGNGEVSEIGGQTE